MDRPKLVSAGLVALWISISFQALSTFILSSMLFFVVDLFSVVLISLPFIVIAFLTYKVSTGKNWARISVLIFFLVFVLPNGLIKSIPFVLSLTNYSAVGIHWLLLLASAFIAVAMLLQLFSLYTFFSKPGSHYFRKPDFEPLKKHLTSD